MNEARVPITPNPSADFRTQVLTLVERLVLAAEENEPLSSSLFASTVLVTVVTQDASKQSYMDLQILYDYVDENKSQYDERNLIKWLTMADGKLLQ